MKCVFPLSALGDANAEEIPEATPQTFTGIARMILLVSVSSESARSDGMQALTMSVALVACLALWVWHDYHEWKKLGRGAIPYNLKGWWIVRGFSLHTREPFSTRMYDSRLVDANEAARLPELPQRRGQRPRLGRHPVPHRQVTQMPDESIKQATRQLFDRFVQRRAAQVHYANSFYERNNPAVIVTDLQHAHPIVKLTQGEAAHWHPIDGSMHMIFSASDAKQIIEKGWGERHGLAGVPRYTLPDTYLMVYAPRNEQELGIIEQLLHAAVGHVGACDCQCDVHDHSQQAQLFAPAVA